MRYAILFCLLCSPAWADLYLVRDTETTWREVESFDSLPAGQVYEIVRVAIGDTPDPDPDPDPQPPTGLRAKIGAAARNANDTANAASLRDLYGTALALHKAGLPLLSTVQLIIRGEAATIDTRTEKAKWADYLTLSNGVLKGNPVAVPQLEQIHLGLQDAAPSGTTTPNWLPKLTMRDWLQWERAAHQQHLARTR